ncbi:hypothetical protein ES332_A04G063800v1 [Gossypium tomentosum]|uniref:Uncharacterized protein n=1 Tax=Gossypium tomentosum TaxID=34277 RepID=A0A5D2QVJ3_GOSTO|nr:hypothetical protein ES332_A04G063800v1 [Gossypium tomentosum]
MNATKPPLSYSDFSEEEEVLWRIYEGKVSFPSFFFIFLMRRMKRPKKIEMKIKSMQDFESEITSFN